MTSTDAYQRGPAPPGTAGGSGPATAGLCWGQRWGWHEQQLPVGQRSPSLHLIQPVELPAGTGAHTLQRALDLTVSRHTALRTTVTVGDDGVPRQTVQPVEAASCQPVRLDGEPAYLAWAQRPFDLTTQYPLRAAVVPLDSGAVELRLVAHHIATDRYGLRLLGAELAGTVRALAEDVVPTPPPADRQPTELAAFEQSAAGAAVNERALAYWLAHDDQLSDVLRSMRAGFVRPSGSMQVARVVVPRSGLQLGELAAAGRSSEGAVAVAAVACALARYLDRADVPISMLVSNRHRAGYGRSVSSLAQAGLLDVRVPDHRDIARVVPLAWAATLAAIRHGHYDGDELSERMTAFESGGRHATVAPPSVNLMPDTDPPEETGPAALPYLGDDPPFAVWAGPVDRPCTGLNFHIGLSNSDLWLELRAGTHLVSADTSVALVVDAMKLLLRPDPVGRSQDGVRRGGPA